MCKKSGLFLIFWLITILHNDLNKLDIWQLCIRMSYLNSYIYSHDLNKTRKQLSIHLYLTNQYLIMIDVYKLTIIQNISLKTIINIITWRQKDKYHMALNKCRACNASVTPLNSQGNSACLFTIFIPDSMLFWATF